MWKEFQAICTGRGITPDPAQIAAARKLEELYQALVGFKRARGSLFQKYVIRPEPPRGLYFWGGVGRGKSFLMDAFYDAVPYKRKRRVHFHAFMHEMHELLKAHRSEDDPLMQVAKSISTQVRLLCFDEFHVSDIADAMILGRLVEALLAQGVVIVTTSNYPPEKLYPNGLQRHLFLPTIALLQAKLDVLEVDGGTDYRLRTLERIETFLVPDDEVAHQKMLADFVAIAGNEGSAGSIEVLEREIPVVRQAPGVVWFTFSDLCVGMRSQNDYLELAQEHHTIMLSGMPRLTKEQASEARRFTWLVDVLYDHRVKLIISAAVEADELYTEGTQAEEFKRTVSRLVEMRSREYLSEPHRLL